MYAHACRCESSVDVTAEALDCPPEMAPKDGAFLEIKRGAPTGDFFNACLLLWLKIVDWSSVRCAVVMLVMRLRRFV